MKKRIVSGLLSLVLLCIAQFAHSIEVFVVQPDRIFRFNSITGEYLGTFGYGFSGSGFISGAICPTDGNIYTGKDGAGAILRFDPYTGEYLGSLATGFVDFPYDVKFGPDGLLYVFNYSSSTSTGSIMRFDPVTGEYKGGLGSGFVGPFGRMAFTSDGILHVTDYSNGRIYRFNPTTGEYLGIYGSGFLTQPFAITPDANGKLLVSGLNTTANVTRFVPNTGEYQGTFGNGFLNQTAGIAALPNNVVLVGTNLTSDGSAYLGSAVMRFDATTGEYLGHFGYGFLQSTSWSIAPELAKTYTGVINSGGINVSSEVYTMNLKDPTTSAILDTVTVSPDAAGNFSFTSYVGQNFRLSAKTFKRLTDSTNVTWSKTGASGILLQSYPGDSNNDDVVNLTDFSKLSQYYGLSSSSTNWNTIDGQGVMPADCDWNNDGVINLSDFSLLSANYGRSGIQ